MTYEFTNAQIRSILNGLGFKIRATNEQNFPLSGDNSPLDDDLTLQAIVHFQTYFKLVPDGIAGDKTKAVFEKVMNAIHCKLDLVMKINPPLRKQAPLYGLRTAQTVAGFRLRYGFELDANPQRDRIADAVVRRTLDRLTSNSNSGFVTPFLLKREGDKLALPAQKVGK